MRRPFVTFGSARNAARPEAATSIAAQPDPLARLNGTHNAADVRFGASGTPVQQLQQRGRSAHKLTDVFTPRRPQLGRKGLVGRRAELHRILEALLDERAHVALYSERGRGKTSLANAVVETLRSQGVAVARHVCRYGAGYDDIMSGLTSDLPVSLLSAPAATAAGRGCASALPEVNIKPSDVASLPSRLSCNAIVFVIDELDRVNDPDVLELLADTLKQVSDRGGRLPFFLVGAADSVEGLLGEHRSIRRNLVPVALPVLADAEVKELLVNAARETGLTFPPILAECITALSRGMPHYVHLLGLRVAQAAAARGAAQANDADLRVAAERLIQETEPRVVALYTALTQQATDMGMLHALRSVAIAEQDKAGQLRATRSGDVIRVGGKTIELNCWLRTINAGVLKPLDSAQHSRLAVTDRELLTYVLLRAVLAAELGASADAAQVSAKPAGEPLLARSEALS